MSIVVPTLCGLTTFFDDYASATAEITVTARMIRSARNPVTARKGAGSGSTTTAKSSQICL